MKILLLEDDKILAETIQEALEENGFKGSPEKTEYIVR